MVRQKDDPGADKHLRFGKILPGLLEALSGFPGVRSIVLHTHGKVGEHHHYHVFWTGEKPVTNQTIRNRLIAYNPLFKEYSGQNDWSMRNHNSYPTWVKYVTDNNSHQVLKSDASFDTIFDEIPKVPIVVDSPIRNSPNAASPTVIHYHTASPEPVKVRARRPTTEEQLIAWVEQKYKWKFNSEWSKARVQSLCPGLNASYQAFFNICGDMAVHKRHGSVHYSQHLALTRHIMYLFSDDELRDELATRFTYKLKAADHV